MNGNSGMKELRVGDFVLLISVSNLMLEIFVSATLPGLETLKHAPFHGICFFVEFFSFFSLVSEISRKMCFHYWY